VTGLLLDTNVLSELRRPRPSPKVVAFVAAQRLENLHISSVTLAEIRFGIELVADAGRRAALSDWLVHKVRPMFVQRVLPVTEDIMFRWRFLEHFQEKWNPDFRPKMRPCKNPVEDGRKAGHTFSQPDLIIAATGLEHGLIVVSRDTSDYEKTGVPVLNPWTAANP
jgi:toxin FitB